MTLSASPYTGRSWRPADSIFQRDWDDPDTYLEVSVHPGGDGGYLEVDDNSNRFARFYPRWHGEASCKGYSDDLFFGESEPSIRPQYSISTIKEARELCVGCPVIEQCLKAALVNREEYGVWAGSTRSQRKKMLRAIEAQEVTLETCIEVFVTGLKATTVPRSAL